MANKLKSLTESERFFYDHAGFGYDPKTETRQQGKIRCARLLAEAEAFVKGQEYQYEWDWDESPDLSCMTQEEMERVHEVLCCCLFNPRERAKPGKQWATLESLCGIVDPDSNYRRVVEAELALSALCEFNRQIEILDAH